MNVLRIRLDAKPAPDRAETWALFDPAGACVKKGRDRRAAWPAADRIEVVLAAPQARIASVMLPPMSASRVAGAAAFALEDQLAGPNTAHHVAASAQGRDGRVRVAIVARSLIAEIVDEYSGVTRIVAECDLATPTADWKWCAREPDAPGFIRRPDGSAFPIDAPSPEGMLPPELEMALAQARRGESPRPRVRVEASFPSDSLARWHRETGIEFVAGTPWQWEAVPPSAFAAAIDLLPRSVADDAAPKPKPVRLFAPALLLASAALALHVIASSVEWGALRVQAWRDAREWRSLAGAAGIAPETAANPAAARLALARRYAEARHEHGMSAPNDALPLLARAAPLLASLPAGSMKRASYADGHWTFDIALANPAAVGELEARMRGAGVPALVASSPAGVRVRIGGS